MTKKRKLVYLLTYIMMFAMLLSFVSGCNKEPVAVSDSEGNIMQGEAEYPVELYGTNMTSVPNSVAVMTNSLADIICTLGYDNLLKARSDECTFTSVAELPSIGKDDNINLDKIKELDIDVILTQKGISSQLEYKLKSMDVKTIVLPTAKTFDDLQQLYMNVGSLLGGSITGYTSAEKKSNDIFVNIENISKLVAPRSTKVCYLYDTEGRTVESGTLPEKVFKLAGAELMRGTGDSNFISDEDMASNNPTYIFCDPKVKQKILYNPSYQGKLWAISNSKVIDMDPNLIECQGKTLSDTVTFLVKEMYPDIVQNTGNEIDMSDYDSSQSQTTTSDSASSSEVVSSETTTSSEVSSEVQSQTSEVVSSQPETSSQEVVSSQSEAVSSQAETSSQSYTVPAGTVLKMGDTGDQVYWMQERLKELGHMYSDPTGTFDELTEQGVMNFQYLSDFEATGVATEDMLNLLYSPNAVTGPDYGA